MRTLGFGSKVIAVCFFAAALVLTLRLPWYGPAPRPASAGADRFGEISGPLEGLGEAITRWLGERDGGTTAWQALATADLVLVALAFVSALAAVAALAPSVEVTARALLRATALAALATTLVKLFDTPGDNALTEPRYGVFVATACALMLTVSAFGLAQQRLRRTARHHITPYEAPVAPGPWQDPGATTPPPGY